MARNVTQSTAIPFDIAAALDAAAKAEGMTPSRFVRQCIEDTLANREALGKPAMGGGMVLRLRMDAAQSDFLRVYASGKGMTPEVAAKLELILALRSYGMKDDPAMIALEESERRFADDCDGEDEWPI